MATPVSSGWTSGSIGPSYAVLSSILGPASGTGRTNMLPGTPAAVGGGVGAGMGGFPASAPVGFANPNIPSTPARQPLMSGGVGGATLSPYQYPGRGSGGTQMNTGAFDQAGNPIYTPEQAYSLYLDRLGGAVMHTPQTDLLQKIMNISQQQAYGPGSLSINSPNSHYAVALQNQATNAALAYPTISPYSTAYGTPSPQAPAPTPQWGYPTAYGQPAPGAGYQYGAGPTGYTTPGRTGWVPGY